MRIKRVMDLLLTIPALVLVGPLMLGIAGWVRLDSRGPAFFRQRRVGLRGRVFEIVKFRTMVVGAERMGELITRRGDGRITRCGRFLRRWKLDELPQLINVVRGEMSLVGPRPELPKYVALYPPDVRVEVLSVPPGLTGIAAVKFRNEEELLASAEDPHKEYVENILPAKIACYRYYVESRSLGMDLMILLRTVTAIFV